LALQAVIAVEPPGRNDVLGAPVIDKRHLVRSRLQRPPTLPQIRMTPIDHSSTVVSEHFEAAERHKRREKKSRLKMPTLEEPSREHL
jgi:hypothetical protein